MFGDDKKAAFACADGFILPSHSEGLPMAVLEAWSYGVPVLMTPGCNLDIGFERGAARRIEPQSSSIAQGLDRFFGASPNERQSLGRRGRALVEDRFTWTQVAKQMYDVYQWMRGESAPPDSVTHE
jgi:poly(glycerol-phosphate) alpha-glucosyltransferase